MPRWSVTSGSRPEAGPGFRGYAPARTDQEVPMSLTATVQPWMRTAGPRAEAALTARTHVAAETTGDTEQICHTVSHDVFFGVPVRTRAGNELIDGTVLVDYDQVRGYYTDRSGSYTVTASAQLKSVATDWFLFNESAAT